MSAIYDNWERLVAAVVKKQQLWELFHQNSRSPSIISEGSDSSFDISGPGSSSRPKISTRKLVLISDFCPAFDVKNVAMASAKLLGRGTFGSAYVATMDDGQRFVVKRLNSVGISELDFKRNMEIVGDVRHENVVSLRAYYSSTDEKLLLYDYYCNGSVHLLLHGGEGGCRKTLDWATRVEIALGAAKGVSHIHRQDGGRLVHGNIKSSNIFLNKQTGIVSDAGLARLTSPVELDIVSTTGYSAPEVRHTWDVTQASDVYSFGVVLLQLLSGRPPQHTTRDGDVVTLVNWIQYVIRYQWSGEVIDVKLRGYEPREEMQRFLRLAMDCVSINPERRPRMARVVEELEKIMGGLEETTLHVESGLECVLEDLLPRLTL
ncbi:hypothetical protein C2S51_018183 [Perilla frutescens var. frutescens]|nr:hypothetical protein C2S51_018183 [Perilla frutescens var. frutescens]